MADLLLPEGARLVHIGPQKTGTTAIQSAMFAAREALAEHGVVYAGDSARPRKAGWAIGLPGGPAERPDIGHWERLVGQARDAGDRRVLISDENYARAKDHQAARIVEDMGGDRVHVLVFARRLDRFLPSQWQERVKYGMTSPFEDWLRRVFGDDESDWERWHVWMGHDVGALVDRWAGVVGSDRLTLVIADDSDRGQLVRVFQDLLGIPDGVLDPQRNPGPANQSLTWAEAEVLRLVMREYAGQGHTRHECTLLGRAIVKGLRSTPAALTGPRAAVLPDWAYRRVHELSEERVERVRALPVRVVGDPEWLRVPAERPEPAVVPDQLLVPAEVAAGAASAAVEGGLNAARYRTTRDEPAGPSLQDAGGRELLRALAERARSRIRRS